MTQKVVQIIRRFSATRGPKDSWADIGFNPGRPSRWNELEEEHRVLILADPGAGKTFEAKDRAEKIRQRGRRAFFIRIEAIDATFEASFEVGTAEEFEAWLESTDDAWFFLDSVDEAQLETPRALEIAIQIFGKRIHPARERAHVFITSRDDAWQALPDRTLVDQLLPFGAPPEEGSGAQERDEFAGGDDAASLKMFRLNGLTEDEIELFASHYGVSDTKAFVDAVRRSNLMSLAQRPFDLKALIAKWQDDQVLGSRFHVLTRLIELQLGPLSGSRSAVRLDPTKAREAVTLLAGAVLMTGKAIIRFPTGAQGPDRIDPKALLQDWTDQEIAALLTCGLFDDVVYGSVRFRHREIRELLGAEWACGLLRQAERREATEQLFFRTRYGEAVIVPRTRPILPWLILLDEGVRDRALALAPEIASEGGDPSQLPLSVRRAMLIAVTEQIASEKD